MKCYYFSCTALEVMGPFIGWLPVRVDWWQRDSRVNFGARNSFCQCHFELLNDHSRGGGNTLNRYLEFSISISHFETQQCFLRLNFRSGYPTQPKYVSLIKAFNVKRWFIILKLIYSEKATKIWLNLQTFFEATK